MTVKYDPSGFYATMGLKIRKGGPGSGSWDGPGQPRGSQDAGGDKATGSAAALTSSRAAQSATSAANDKSSIVGENQRAAQGVMQNTRTPANDAKRAAETAASAEKNGEFKLAARMHERAAASHDDAAMAHEAAARGPFSLGARNAHTAAAEAHSTAAEKHSAAYDSIMDRLGGTDK